MPEAIGILILDAAGFSGITGLAGAGAFTIGGVSLASVVGTTALVGTLAAAQYLTKPNAPKPSDGQVTRRQPIPPRRRNYGRVKVAGTYMYTGTANGSLFTLLAINQGEIDAFEEHWLGDIQVTVDGDNYVSPVDPANTAFVKDGHKFVQLFVEMGTDDDDGFAGPLGGNFPEWDAAHRGRGVAKVLIVCQQPAAKDYTQIYPAGEPIYRGVIRASKLWDPRDGTQDKDDKATWKWSDNAALEILDYHRHRDGMNLAPLDGVFFTPAAIAEEWVPSANICDEAIALKAGGTEPRYRCAGGYDLPTLPKDVLPSMLNTCQGQVFMRTDGAIGLRVGKTVAPNLVFDADEKHIVNYSGFQTGDNLFLTTNNVTAKFTGADYDYQETDVTPWRNEADITARGQELTSDIDLTWVPSFPQARRLMKIEYYRKNPAWVGQFTSDLFALNGYGDRYLRLTLSDLEISGVDFEITSFGIDPSAATCPLGVSAFDAIAYGWNAALEEGDPPPVPDTTVAPVTIDAPEGVTGTPTVRTVSTGTNGVVLVIGWDAPIRIDLTAVAQYKLHSDSVWLDASVTSDDLSAETPILQDGSVYDVRVQFVTGTRTSDWSEVDSIAVDVPADPPTGFTAAGGSGAASLAWTNSTSPNLTKVHVYHGTGSFGAATSDGTIPAAPGSPGADTLTLAAGTWNIWIASETDAGVQSAPVGPAVVSVT